MSASAILGSLLVPPRGRVIRLPEVTRHEIGLLGADLYIGPSRPSPGIVLVLGALREGRRYPLLVTLARSIAGCGYAVLVPELGRLRRLILGEDALEDLITAAQALTRQDNVADAPVGLFGFSLGGSLALLAAADDRLRGRVACVASMGAYFSLQDMLAAATTGPPLAAPSTYTVVASLVATLPEPDRVFLERLLEEQPESPLAAVAHVDAASVGLEAQAVLTLLRNRDPAAVPGLIRNLKGGGSMMSRLSPQRITDRIDVPVWLLHDERDRFVPFQQSQLMRQAVQRRPNFRFISTRLLEHTEPNPPALDPRQLFGDYLPGIAGLFRFAYGPLKAVKGFSLR